jgi:hypothetical protein
VFPALSQKLLVNQSVVADPSQPAAAAYDGLSGPQVPAPGVAQVSCEKLGLWSVTHFISWAAGVTIGEVTIEAADEPSYTGPWQAIAPPVTFNGVAPKQDVVTIQGTFGAIRHRITQPVVGGSVTTKVVGTA